MNLDRLKPENKSGKLLRDLEEIYELECMIDQATRVTRTTQTLLDVILTNKADLFSCSGAVEQNIVPHGLWLSYREGQTPYCKDNHFQKH